MASTSLMEGSPYNIIQGISYALPNKVVRVQSSAPVEVSINESVWNALTGADTTGAETGASFIRCPGGNATVVCKGAADYQSKQIVVSLSDTALIPTTGSMATWGGLGATGRIVKIEFWGGGALAVNDTNYIQFSVLRYPRDGQSTVEAVAQTDVNTTKLTGGSALVGQAVRELVLSSTPTNLKCNAGERMLGRAIVTGTLGAQIAGCMFQYYVQPD